MDFNIQCGDVGLFNVVNILTFQCDGDFNIQCDDVEFSM